MTTIKHTWLATTFPCPYPMQAPFPQYIWWLTVLDRSFHNLLLNETKCSRDQPIANDDKMQSVIANMVSLQAVIMCLTKTNVEWRNYGFIQGYKYVFNKLYAASRHIFSSSSELTTSSYHKHGGTVISATDRCTHRVHLSGEDVTGDGRWSYFTLLGK
jgi:hypothetical protein